MRLTFIIPDEKEDKFKDAFLCIHPVPEDKTIQEDKWIKRCIKNMIYSVYEQGVQQLFRAQNKPVYDEGIVEE